MKVAPPARLERATHGLGIKTSELPNLLKLLEPIDITKLLVNKFFPILTAFGIFGKHFHTRIHTQPTGFSNRLMVREKNITAHNSYLYLKSGPLGPSGPQLHHPLVS
jgi:hypothetical protein